MRKIGRRPLGLPRLRWRDNIGEKYLEAMGLKNWKELPKDRKK